MFPPSPAARASQSARMVAKPLPRFHCANRPGILTERAANSAAAETPAPAAARSVAGNLHASLLLTDPGPAEHWPQLALVAALAAHDAVVEVAPEVKPMLELKWPNDLLLSGAKFAGILIEGEGREQEGAVAIGIGVNCTAHPAQAAAYPATDLLAAGTNVSADRLFASLCVKMPGRLAQWNSGLGFATIRADWLARAAGLGENIRVALPDRELAGRFEGLDEAGCLVLTGPDGAKEVVAAGEVISFGGSQ